MTDTTTRNEAMDQRSRTEYECNVLFKLVPPKEVLILARQQVAKRQQENNQMNISPNDVEKKEKEIVREVFKMLRELINETKMVTVLMNGRKWMENAVEKADRRLERAEKREKRQQRLMTEFDPFPPEYTTEWEELKKLPAGEERQKALEEHLRMLKQKNEKMRRSYERRKKRKDEQNQAKEGSVDAEAMEQLRRQIMIYLPKTDDFITSFDEEFKELLKLPAGEEKQNALEEHMRKLKQWSDEQIRFFEIAGLKHENEISKSYYDIERSQRDNLIKTLQNQMITEKEQGQQATTSAKDMADLLKLPEGEEKQMAFKEHIRKLEERNEERRRFSEIEGLKHDNELLKCRYDFERSQRDKQIITLQNRMIGAKEGHTK